MTLQLPKRFHWILAGAGIGFLLAGIVTFRDAAVNSPEPQRLTLLELLDGGAKANRHVAITDFRLCRRYVKRGYKHEPGPKRWISHIGIVPAGSGDEFGQVRVIVEPEYANEQSYLIAEWGRKDSLTGVLKKADRLGGWELEAVRQAYPEFNLDSGLLLMEGRTPPTNNEGWWLMSSGAACVFSGIIWWRWRRRTATDVQ